ncbi:hypothetical protein ACWGTO_12555 [Mesorhizobium sp. PL10]
MRIVFTSFMAFFLSLLAGAIGAVGLAVNTGAHEEYILVFFACGLVTAAVTILFFIAQFFPNPLKAINWVGIGTFALFALIGFGLIGWTFSQPPEGRDWGGNLPIIAGLVLSSLATIVVHWLFVQWRVRRGQPGFGRGEARA